MDEDLISHVLLLVYVIVFGILSTWFSIEDEEHRKIHEELGYESIGVIQTTNKFGDPYFYRAVRYKDGCEKTIRISGAEYFEEVNND